MKKNVPFMFLNKGTLGISWPFIWNIKINYCGNPIEVSNFTWL
jgi:hypothetical protein